MKPGYIIFFAGTLAWSSLTSCSHNQKGYYPDGGIRSEIGMKHGKYHGDAFFYYESGHIQMECVYDENRLDGPLIRYYENGRKKEEMFYRNNRQDSVYRMWDSEGNLVLACSFADSLHHGPYREFYTNSQVKTEGQYLHGNYDGQWMYYDPSGRIVGTGSFANGNGTLKAFHENGRVKQIVHYRDNRKHGTEQIYSVNGELLEEIIYENGEMIK
jgi:antitoxin component YwqK of YwqJK toxin-antitoxin module